MRSRHIFGAVHHLLNIVGSVTRKVFQGKATTIRDEWQDRDNSRLGLLTVLGLIAAVVVGWYLFSPTLPRPDRYAASNAAAVDSGPCDPREFAGYREASPLARRIAEGAPWDLKDDNAALALLDSFQGSPDHAFYSAVMLRSLAKADGAYAEAVGVVLHDRLLKDPCYFLTCCWENGCDGQDGLLLWTRAIAYELLIVHEEDPLAGLAAYGRQVEEQARIQCDMQTGSRANEFLWRIGEHIRKTLPQDTVK